MKNRVWLVAATATAGVTVAAGLWIDALRTGHTDGGLRADPGVPRGSTSSASPSASTSSPSSPSECVGTRSEGSLPGFPGAEGGSDDTPLYRTLAYIDLDAKRRHSDVFTGLSVDAPHNTLKVWRIPSAALDADVCGAAEKGVRIRLFGTDANRKDLDALADRISDDIKRWDGTFDMREVGVQEEGFVHVGVDDPAKAWPILKKAYGAHGERYIQVEHVEQAHINPG